MVLIALETVPAESKPPAAVPVRISAGERHGFVGAASLSTRVSSLEQLRAGDLAESLPNLVRRIGAVSACADKLSPLTTCSAAAAPSMRLRVFLSGFTSASMARRD